MHIIFGQYALHWRLWWLLFHLLISITDLPQTTYVLLYNERICKLFTAYFTGPKVVKPQKSTVPVPSFQSSVSRPASSTAVPGKKRSVARKSTTGSSQSNQSIISSSPMSEGELQMSKWEAPWLKKRQPATNTSAGTKKSRGKGQVEIVERSQETWRFNYLKLDGYMEQF